MSACIWQTDTPSLRLQGLREGNIITHRVHSPRDCPPVIRLVSTRGIFTVFPKCTIKSPLSVRDRSIVPTYMYSPKNTTSLGD